jgi:hypothetical protein
VNYSNTAAEATTELASFGATLVLALESGHEAHHGRGNFFKKAVVGGYWKSLALCVLSNLFSAFFILFCIALVASCGSGCLNTGDPRGNVHVLSAAAACGLPVALLVLRPHPAARGLVALCRVVPPHVLKQAVLPAASATLSAHSNGTASTAASSTSAVLQTSPAAVDDDAGAPWPWTQRDEVCTNIYFFLGAWASLLGPQPPV